jgi:hypothetical protein
MTTLNKATLTASFEQGDVPQGTDYANLIDSQVNVAETSVQAMAGPLATTELITPRVSATNLNVTGILSANTLSFSNLTATTLTATSIGAATVSATTVNTAIVSADTIFASAASFQGGVVYGTGIVSAAGTAQGTAATLSFPINTLRGVTDGAATGFTPPQNRTGLVQYILNDGPSANLWPPVGGRINGLAANAVFPLAASTAYTVVHFTASAMTVK